MAWLLLPLVAAAFVLGVWLAGGVLTNSFRASMALVTVWYLAAGIAVVLVARARRGLALPVLGGYLLSAGAVGLVLFLSVARDKVADEKVAVGVPASDVAETPDAAPARAQPVQEQRGTFTSGEHETTGAAAIVRLPDGSRRLTLTRLDTSAGPDLRVRLVPGKGSDGGAKGNIDLGGLKGNRGDQQYTLPRDVAARGHTVVIWCRAFSVAFGSAHLRAS